MYILLLRKMYIIHLVVNSLTLLFLQPLSGDGIGLFATDDNNLSVAQDLLAVGCRFSHLTNSCARVAEFQANKNRIMVGITIH